MKTQFIDNKQLRKRSKLCVNLLFLFKPCKTYMSGSWVYKALLQQTQKQCLQNKAKAKKPRKSLTSLIVEREKKNKKRENETKTANRRGKKSNKKWRVFPAGNLYNPMKKRKDHLEES